VFLAIFLLANLRDTLINLSSATGNLVQVNHWIQFVESMSKPTNEPCRKSTCKPTNDRMNGQTSNQTKQQLEQDALLPGNLSSKEVLFQVSMMDDEIQNARLDKKIFNHIKW
jgi:hypothetical protein